MTTNDLSNEPINVIPFDEKEQSAKPKVVFQPIDLAEIEYAGMLAREMAVVERLRKQGLID